jgi:leucyl aminopeptidase
MKLQLNLGMTSATKADYIIVGTHSANDKLTKSNWSKEIKEAFDSCKLAKDFDGKTGSNLTFDMENGRVLVLGLGDKKAYTNESVRNTASLIITALKAKAKSISIQIDTLTLKGNLELTASLLTESIRMTDYSFDQYLTKKSVNKIKTINFDSKSKKTMNKKVLAAIEESETVASSVNIARDFVNEPPNVLNSESYAKMVEKDAKNIKGVKVKTLGLSELKKEKMGMFLSVNAGSNFGPRLVHLTYTPSKVTKNTKHIALVGKGLTFDTGGYSLKPGASMVNMKFDMAGSSTVYGAFRAAAMLGLPVKVSCFLGMTDNAVNEKATMPDSIVTARNGKTVEILNTDAEGRLVLGDVLSYASDFKPDALIDAATLTGACLMALGTEVGGLMSNDKKLASNLLKSAKNTDENLWELPIIDQWRNDMKSNIADLKNIGGSRWGGTAKAAAFLENFVGENISWAHLDIAGVGDSQGHLPYCPKKGGSGVMIRTLIDFIRNSK